jgi:hypothetical protein
VGVVNEEGELSSVTQQEIPVDIPEAELENARKQKFVYAADLLMKPGTHKLAAGVRDQLSGETAFISEYVSARE